MRFKRIIMCVAAALALLSQMSMAQTPGTCADMTPGQLTSLNGFVPFQGTANLWNTNIANAPVDPNSANIMNFIGLSTTVHPDFGSGLYDGQSMGIPYQVVSASQPDVKILLGAYGSESDPGPAPIPANALVEGYPKPGSGDRHVLVLDKDSCFLYELYNSHLQNSGNWKGDSSAVWDLTMNELRPYTWTSADAAGLPIFPGLARYDEVAAGAIHHALRFTVPVTQEAFVAPASHWASGDTNPSAPPMGTRLRLKASFDISGFSAHNRVILTALKQYGMILADNGSAIYISGAPNSKWSNDDLGESEDFDRVRFRGGGDGYRLHSCQCAVGSGANHLALRRLANFGFGGTTGHAELDGRLECEQPGLQRHHASRRGSRKQRRGESDHHNHLYAGVDQRVWADAKAGDGDGGINREKSQLRRPLQT